MAKKIIAKPGLTVPTYTKLPTKNPDVFRFVDREGEWTHYWIESKKKFVPGVTYILGIGYPKGEGFMKYLLNTTKEEADKKLKVAGEEGSRSHEAVAYLLGGARLNIDTKFMNEITGRQESLNADEWWHMESWVNWFTKYQFEPLIVESSLYIPEADAAGTLDSLGTILVPDKDKCFPESVWGKRILILVDWKFSSGIWDSYKAQAAVYARGVLASKDLMDIIKPYGDSTGLWTGIVRCGTKHKEGFEMKAWSMSDTGRNYDLYFKSARVFFDEQVGDFEPENRDIPATFQLKIKLTAPKPKTKKTKSNKIKKPNKK